MSLCAMPNKLDRGFLPGAVHEKNFTILLTLTKEESRVPRLFEVYSLRLDLTDRKVHPMNLTYSLLLLLIMCLVTTLTVVAGRHLSAHSASSTSNLMAPISAQGSSGQGPVRMIRFVLSEEGIYPRTMRVDQGLINLALEDKTNGSNGLLVESIIGNDRVRL